jgi:uncharacterized membrane protein
MRFEAQFAVAALLGSQVAPALAGPPRYEVTIVGEGSPLAHRAFGEALSSDGQVTGTLNFASPATAFRWDGQLAAIEAPPGDVSTWGHGINASGTVVGSLELGGVPHPFVSRPGEPARPLAPLGSAQGIAWDINDAGWVVGGVRRPGGQGSAFRWRDGVSEALPMPGWANAAVAAIITPGGDIYGIATDGAERIQSVMWTDSGVTELPSLDGWDWTTPTAATDGGVAVGNAMNDAGAGAPVVWEDGQIRVLPHDPATLTYVSGVNVAGDIVGFSLGSGARALLWSGGELIHLQDTVPAGFDGQLAMAHDINDRGQILVSAWFDGPEADRTVLLTPIPAPATAVVLAGLLCSATRRRRAG